VNLPSSGTFDRQWISLRGEFPDAEESPLPGDQSRWMSTSADSSLNGDPWEKSETEARFPSHFVGSLLDSELSCSIRVSGISAEPLYGLVPNDEPALTTPS
jgi:hypothetical protein